MGNEAVIKATFYFVAGKVDNVSESFYFVGR